MTAKGFTDEEIVALASIESMGTFHDNEHTKTSPFERLDNFLFKSIISGKNNIASLPIANTLNNDQQLRDHVQKYADDKKAYHKALGEAMVKLINLGQEEAELVHVENLMEDNVLSKLY